MEELVRRFRRMKDEQMDDATKDPAPLSQRIPRIRDRSRAYQISWALLDLFGIDVYPHRTRNAIKGLPRFFSDWRKFNRLVGDVNGRARLSHCIPCLLIDSNRQVRLTPTILPGHLGREASLRLQSEPPYGHRITFGWIRCSRAEFQVSYRNRY